jgi:hypothetical protein
MAAVLTMWLNSELQVVQGRGSTVAGKCVEGSKSTNKILLMGVIHSTLG